MFVTRMNQAAIEALANELRAASWEGNGFIAPVEVADALSQTWCGLSGDLRRLLRELRVFLLSSVVPPRFISGAMLQASSEQIDLLTHWVDAFYREINEPHPHSRRAIELINEKQLFVWRDTEIRAMTAVAGPTPHGIRINHVFTPRPWRGRGYASNLVAAVSQRMLDGGRRHCFLNTDLSNPTSNKIYQEIGYRPVCDFRHWMVGRYD